MTAAELLWWAGDVAAEESQGRMTCVLASDPALVSDALVSGESGRENRLRVTWARRDPGLLPSVESDVRLRLELELDGLASGTQVGLRDGSSSLGFDATLGRAGRFGLRVFPFDTDYERLGFLHGLSWGGTDVARGESIFVAQHGSVPGLEAGFEGARVQVGLGLRWARAADAVGARRLWGALLRASLSPRGTFGADFALGYFERSALPVAGSPDGRGFVEGGTLRLVWRRGQQRAPELGAEPFRAPTLHEADGVLLAPELRGAALALEAVTLLTRLRRFEAPAETRLGLAPAAGLSGSVRGELLGAHAALTWRSLAFVQRNAPGLMRGETTPVGAIEQAEVAGWVGASLSAGFGLTPSLQVGVLLPAALVTASVLPGFVQSFVVRDAGTVVALPIGSERLPVVAARAALRVELSRSLSVSGFIGYERDPNRVRLLSRGLAGERAFANPDALGLGASAQASF